MFTTPTLALALAVLGAASPLTRRTTSTFALISIHSGDPDVHLRPITASDFKLWLGKPTASYCPSDVVPDCPSGNSTSFASGDGGLSMNVEVPGGQLVYVATDGTVGYTQAHSGSVPAGAITTGFEYTPPAPEGSVGTLSGPGKGFVACPTAGVYQIKAALEGVDTSACTGIAAGALPVEGVGAWQYS